uniref:Uncharacterized protein n=1 Tax=Trypanosoma congolense (strain IL3000) TaxID=1068625 RepID=G0V1G2_TRYCI|nr:hypothetical protein, unlikely [Trypanosoma congolense IL3000]
MLVVVVVHAARAHTYMRLVSGVRIAVVNGKDGSPLVLRGWGAPSAFSLFFLFLFCPASVHDLAFHFKGPFTYLFVCFSLSFTYRFFYFYFPSLRRASVRGASGFKSFVVSSAPHGGGIKNGRKKVVESGELLRGRGGRRDIARCGPTYA